MRTPPFMLLFCGSLLAGAPLATAGQRQPAKLPTKVAPPRKSPRIAGAKSLGLALAVAKPQRAVTVDLRVPKAWDFLRDFRNEGAAGASPDLAPQLATRMGGIPGKYAPLVSKLVAHGMTAVVQQAVESTPGDRFDAMPSASTLSLTKEGLEREYQDRTVWVEGGSTVTWHSTREADQIYASAHRDPRVVAASEADRSKVLAEVREEKLGRDLVAAYKSLGAINQVRLANRNVPFAVETFGGHFETQERPPAARVRDFTPYLYNAIRKSDPHMSGLNTVLPKMLNQPLDYLAVYALTHQLFDSASGATEPLKALVKAHVARLPVAEQRLYVLFAELSKIEAAKNATGRPEAALRAEEVEILRALKASLGGAAKNLVIDVAQGPRKRSDQPSGYARALAVNYNGSQAWDTGRGYPAVEYKGDYAPAWR